MNSKNFKKTLRNLKIAEKADSVYRETNQNVKSLDRIQQLKLDREKAVKLKKAF